MVVYICTKFREKYSGRYQSNIADTIFIRKFSKRHNFVKNIGGKTSVMLAELCDIYSMFYHPSPHVFLLVASLH